MINIPEQIELLRAELRGCIDPIERIQIRAELDAAIRQAAAEERGETMSLPVFDPRPG